MGLRMTEPSDVLFADFFVHASHELPENALGSHTDRRDLNRIDAAIVLFPFTGGAISCCQMCCRRKDLLLKQKGWNRWIPALFGPCERGELNPHEHTLTAT